MGERLPIAPTGLGRDGRLLWRHMVKEYDLSVGQLELLGALCRTQDRLTAVRGELDGEPLLIESKQGTRSHPLLASERDLVQTWLRLARAIGLHADPEEAADPYDSKRRQLAAVQGHQYKRKVL